MTARRETSGAGAATSAAAGRSAKIVREVTEVFARRGWPEQSRDSAALQTMFREWADSSDPARHAFDVLMDEVDQWLESVYAEDEDMHCAVLVFASHLLLLQARWQGHGRRCLLQ